MSIYRLKLLAGYSLVILFTLMISTTAQTKRETRAVWIAANFRLDWPPPTYNSSEQKEALLKILDNVEKKNLNTIYFQVRYNSTVLFESSYEPWSYYLTGVVGGNPTYDPLDFVIREAHKRGIEVHAWFNMVRCFNGSEENVFDHPGHIMNTKPEWVRKVTNDGQTSYWLDPGIPEVQDYLSNIVIDLAEKYEIDGIQLDYIRYPSREMNDSETYELFGNSEEIDQWRRDNITAIVRNISRVVNIIDPDIKLGAAPIGVYVNKPGARGMQAYSEIYQESRRWLKEGLLDYLAPQIYWNFEDDPKFNLLVDDWVKESSSRNIVVGIASYKPDVKQETRKMIDYSRSAGAQGVSFFRYSFIEDEHYFDNKAFPAPMYWKEPGPPLSPSDLTISVVDEKENIYGLNWAIPEIMMGAEDIKYYSIYNLYNSFDKLRSENLFKIIPADKTSLNFSIPYPGQINYYFVVKSLDKFWNESRNSTNTAILKIPVLHKLAEQSTNPDNIVIVKKNGNRFLIVKSNIEEEIEMKDESGNTLEEKLSKGLNIIMLNETLNSSAIIELRFNSSGKKMSMQISP